MINKLPDKYIHLLAGSHELDRLHRTLILTNLSDRWSAVRCRRSINDQPALQHQHDGADARRVACRDRALATTLLALIAGVALILAAIGHPTA
ncbi:MAG: hypothetical protein WKF84_09860 [Pyrinomonadaceae bacterium]